MVKWFCLWGCNHGSASTSLPLMSVAVDNFLLTNHFNLAKYALTRDEDFALPPRLGAQELHRRCTPYMYALPAGEVHFDPGGRRARRRPPVASKTAGALPKLSRWGVRHPRHAQRLANDIDGYPPAQRQC